MSTETPRVKRTLVNVRLSEPVIAKIDSLAAQTGGTRTEILRAAVSMAMRDPDRLVKRVRDIRALIEEQG